VPSSPEFLMKSYIGATRPAATSSAVLPPSLGLPANMATPMFAARLEIDRLAHPSIEGIRTHKAFLWLRRFRLPDGVLYRGREILIRVNADDGNASNSPLCRSLSSGPSRWCWSRRLTTSRWRHPVPAPPFGAVGGYAVYAVQRI